MDYSFPRYLLAKQTVDDRALNRHVLETLRQNLPQRRIRVIEIGAGMGNMLARLLSWGLISHADYVHEDSLLENIRFASEWIPDWAAHTGRQVQRLSESQFRVFDSGCDVMLTLRPEEFTNFVGSKPPPVDLLVAHAFLDLLTLRQALPQVLSLTRDLAWLTVNFDGLSCFEPTIDAALDGQIVDLYHRTMDARPTGGDSRAGRHLLVELQHLGVHVLDAGSSDWVVYAHHGKYPADEAYFLEFILHFFEESLLDHPDLDQGAFAGWLAARRAQILPGELVYVAHQRDILARI